MKAIVNTGPGKLEWREIQKPEPGPGQVRIRTAYCGICATDIEMIAGWKRTGFPAIPGHEWSGIVDAAGKGISKKWINRPCVAENVLSDGGEVGFEHPGGYGEYFLTDASNVHFLHESRSLPEASLIEPLAVAVRGLKRLNPEEKDDALIFGDGVIGLCVLLLLKQKGARKVYMIGGRKARLALAKSMGAARIFNYHQLDGKLSQYIGRSVKTPFANIVEASGSMGAIEASIDLIAKDGKILVLGDYKDRLASFSMDCILHKEIEMIGSNASAGAWKQAVSLFHRKRLPFRKWITHIYPAERFNEAMETMNHKREGVMKVILKWGDNDA